MGYFKSWPFRLVPERNPDIWADRSKLLSKTQAFFDVKGPSPSRILLVWGAFGAGKSHLLKHFAWRLENEKTGFVVFSPFPKQAIKGFHQLYQEAFAQKMNFYLLGETFAKIWKSEGGRDELGYLFKIAEQVDHWYDFAQVVLTLGKLFSNSPKLSDPYFFLCRTWLSGHKLRAAERRFLGVNSDIRTDEDAIRLFSSLVRLLTYVGGVRFVVWMLDDCHVLKSKFLERKKDLILYGLKTAFDECPDNFVLVLSFATKDPEAVEDFLIPDLLRRIETLKIAALSKRDAFIFVEDLLKTHQNVSTPIYYPFAQKECIDHVIEEVAKSDLSPGNLMSHLHKLVRKAEKVLYPDLITLDFVRNFYEKNVS